MKRFSMTAGLLIATATVASCVRAPVERLEWPDGLPPIDHYERIYKMDAENRSVQTREQYLQWVVRFYKGWKLYQDGWHMTTRDVLHDMEDGAGKHRMREKLAHLGKLISGEWAKNSDSRRIRSRELSIWGQALVESMAGGGEEALIDRVTRDVEALVSGDLEPIEINHQRYR